MDTRFFMSLCMSRLWPAQFLCALGDIFNCYALLWLASSRSWIAFDLLEIGNEVFTVGFPYSFAGEKTLTTGHVAAFENGLIKIDTSVNNGNSGGALFNTNGEIVGIVNAKLGSLSAFLKNVEQAKPQASMSIGGIDPVQTIQQMIREMRRNLNLGIGYAVPSDTIASISPLVKTLIV